MGGSTRTLVGTALAVGALLAALFLLRSSGRDPAGPSPAPSAAAPAPAPAAIPPRASARAPLETPPVASTREPDAPEPAPPAPASASAACRVLGRVVDQGGLPLAGIPVRLSGYRTWAEGHYVPRLTGKHDYRGFESLTDADGAFRFEVPVPTIAPTALEITPGPFLASVRAVFGGERADARPALRAGENELGVFVLTATGAVRGTVVSRAGHPLEGAELSVTTGPVVTLGLEADSDASGGYLVGHVQPGSYGVSASCEGHLSRFQQPVLVEAGRITEGVDFVLAPAPTLAGRVVDEEGRGLAGAELWGWPRSGGKGAGAQSAADGSFTVHLPQDEPYTLQVELDGYDTFGLDDRSTHYAPGTHDLRIVLRRAASARTRFVVIDAASGAPLERFGLEIERDRGSQAVRTGWTNYRANPRHELHAGGEVEVAARPGLDLFTVCAPGYERRSGDVRHEGEGDARQVVALAPAGLSGRVTRDGRPAAGAAVRLESGSMESGASGPFFEPDRDAVQQATTDAAGRFRFDCLDAGLHRISARASDGACGERVLEVPARGPVDAGELALLSGATILGQVLVPPGRSPAGLQVYLAPWQHDVARTTDDDGRFRFDGLAPGVQRLLLDESAGVVTSASTEVELAAGETREVVIDARANGTCTVALAIELTGASAAGYGVWLSALDDPQRRHELGTTDEHGRVAGWAPAFGLARVELARRGLRLRHPEPLGPLELDRALERGLRFEVGTLELELPAGLALPARCSARLELVAPSGEKDARAPDVPRAGGVLLVEPLLAGEYELTLRLQDAEAPLEAVPHGTGTRTERPTLHTGRARAVVRAGARARVELR